jgi:sensor c-di-GMP phosphodiesterase-like protein
MQFIKKIESRQVVTTIAIIFIAILAVAAPVVLAINQSWKYGHEAETKKVLGYAKDVQARTDATTDQIASGIKRLKASKSKDPCSDENLAIMRDIDLSSSYVQAIGHVSNTVFECSSLGAKGSGWSLGPVDFVSSNGVALRTDVKIPFAPTTSFIVVELDSYAAIINKSLPVDATVAEPDASLASFSQDNHRFFALRGVVESKWLENLSNENAQTFLADGYLVAIVKSKKYRTAALAALPVSYIDTNTRNLALKLVPIGLVAGLIFALAMYNLFRVQTSMPSMIKSGLKHNEFFMLYQPVIDLQTGQCKGVEALMRWRRATGEIVPPDIFIQVAEDVGLIDKLTLRMIELVSKDASNIFKQYPDFHIAVNLSAFDLHSKQTVELLRGLKYETKAGRNNLIVEATERGLMKADLVREIFKEIRKDGINVAIDDFGTGYSSLSYLETFEIDYLKIDKSFVDKIGTEAPISYVVLHVIELAKELKLEMVAEGVETEFQAQLLLEHGIQYAQGWLYGKPMPLNEVLLKFLNRTEKTSA